MRANWVENTVDAGWAGGSATISLAAVTGSPGIGNAFGTSGARLLRYQILEYTDSTRQTLVRAESGIGLATLSASPVTLARTVIQSTWDGTTYLPNPNSSTAPSALTSFSSGSAAANIRVLIAPDAMDVTPPGYSIPSISGGDNIGIASAHMVGANVGSQGINAGQHSFWFFRLSYARLITQATVKQNNTFTSGNGSLLLAFHEIAADGTPGNQVVAFNAITIGTSAANRTSAALSTPWVAQPANYWVQALFLQGTLAGGTSLNLVAGTQTLDSLMPTYFGIYNTAAAIIQGASSQTALAASGFTTPISVPGANYAPIVFVK